MSKAKASPIFPPEGSLNFNVHKPGTHLSPLQLDHFIWIKKRSLNVFYYHFKEHLQTKFGEILD